MRKYLLSILFIGLAWGQAEPDTSQIDYYQMGIELANEDFNPTLSYMTGCSGLGFFLYRSMQWLVMLKYQKNITRFWLLMEGNNSGKDIKRD